MPQNEFQIGDVVELKSGGQQMTVKDTENHMVYCDYWNDTTKMFLPAGPFDYRTLAKVEKTK